MYPRIGWKGGCLIILFCFGYVGFLFYAVAHSTLPSRKEMADVYGTKQPKLFYTDVPSQAQVEKILRPLEKEVLYRQEQYDMIGRLPVRDWRERSKNAEKDWRGMRLDEAWQKYHDAYWMAPAAYQESYTHP